MPQRPHKPPVVLVPACQRVLGRHPSHVVGQRVKRLAPDGIVDAFRWVVPSAEVPWGPAEWQAASNPLSPHIFQAFGEVCRAWQARKHAPAADKLLR